MKIKNALVGNFLEFLVIITFIAFLILRISPNTTSDNDISRLAGIISVARYGELNIDQTVQKVTGDRVEYAGKKYSSKPPALNVLIGLIVKGISSVKPAWLQNDIAIYRLSTLIITVTPLIFLFMLFKYLLERILSVPSFKALFFSLFLVLGTLIFTFSSSLNNHILIAFLQLVLFKQLVLNFPKTKLDGLIIGLLCGAIFAVDITYGVVVVPLSFIFLYTKNKFKDLNLFFYVLLGSVPLVGFHLILSYIQFHTIIPPQLLPEIYLSYPNSKWIGDVTGMLALNHPIALRLFNYTFGSYGLFLYQPILLLPFLNKTNWKNKVWIYAVSITFGYILFNAIMQPDYGGSSFGPRRFLPLIPMLYWFVVKDFFAVWKDKYNASRFLAILLLCLTIGISILGYLNPWQNWNYFNGTERYFYFPLVFTVRKMLGWSII